MKEERRQHSRVRLNLPVSIQTEEGPVERTTYNISPKGAFIRGWYSPELNEVIDMVISGSKPLITTKAIVVWSSSQASPDEIMPRGMGVEFIKISDEDRETISSLISAYLESKAWDKEDESLVDDQVTKEEMEDKKNPTLEPPKQCPRGHKHLSWTANEDDLFCWDCNRRYPLAECIGPKDAEPPSDTEPED